MKKITIICQMKDFFFWKRNETAKNSLICLWRRVIWLLVELIFEKRSEVKSKKPKFFEEMKQQKTYEICNGERFFTTCLLFGLYFWKRNWTKQKIVTLRDLRKHTAVIELANKKYVKDTRILFRKQTAHSCLLSPHIYKHYY